MEIIYFLLGIILFLSKNWYLCLLLLIPIIFRLNYLLIIWFGAGIISALIHQYLVSPDEIFNQPMLSHSVIEGQIQSLVKQTQTKQQFYFSIHQLNNKKATALVYLTCYQHCPAFKAGQHWQLAVKLSHTRPLSNPGGFDSQTYFSAHHVYYTGTIKSQSATLLETPKGILSIREKLGEQLQVLVPSTQILGVVQALTVGMTSSISSQEWTLFKHTGTVHLLVISGAHISLMIGIGYWFFNLLWRRMSLLCLWIPAPQIASLVGLLIGISYAVLAGGSIPTQRAIVSASFFVLPYCCYQQFTTWQIWRYALLLVLIIEPHAVQLPGFYLSFLAVACLIASSQRFYYYQGIKKLAVTQVACLFGLLPSTLFWFSYGSLTSLIANIIAIPLVSYIIVPLSLMVLFTSFVKPFALLIVPLQWAVHGLLCFLSWIDKASFMNISMGLSNPITLMALMVATLTAVFIPLRSYFPLISLLIMSAITPYYHRPAINTADIHIMDVGQGLAVIVQTTHHLLIYDTGTKFYQGGDMAQAVLIPYLKTLGIKAIDAIVISHPDLDHRGGLESLRSNYLINELIVNEPKIFQRASSCHKHDSWKWDGITFTFLKVRQSFSDKNNTSCVLQVANEQGQILLTGDIEKPAEAALIREFGKKLASDVLVVPHHGSKTSSSEPFIQTVSPSYAIISAGFNNRFHFPHQQPLDTFKRHSIAVLNTAECGMISLKLTQKNSIKAPECFIGLSSKNSPFVGENKVG